ncbi:hypothetical protein [Reinekea sp.]|jgi:protein-tyrosine kinase|uniref:hypothetical protein n=1 Tax=Reinekea sp. TaxID=1970455 RepID=UPI0039893436
MDSNKLFKAFEKNKASRQATTETKPVLTKSKETSPLQVALQEVQKTEHLFESKGSVKDIKNPNPILVSEMRRKKLVYSGMKNRAVLNAFRELRIKLIGNGESGNIAVMISSVDADDSSIVTALNLAISFSLDVKSSALLVDCNPYGTNLAELVSSELDEGITDYMQSGNMRIEDIIYPSGIDRVNVIPAGNNPASAVEQFSSQEMQNLLYELRNRYPERFIVINAPPVLVSSEARVLTKYVDHTILTVPYGKSNLDSIEDSVEALGAENVSGVVYQQ